MNIFFFIFQSFFHSDNRGNTKKPLTFRVVINIIEVSSALQMFQFDYASAPPVADYASTPAVLNYVNYASASVVFKYASISHVINHASASAFETTMFDYFHKLLQLKKGYKAKKKFTSIENNFEFKLIMFLKKCRRVELFQQDYLKAASLMLSKQTLIVFYVNRFLIISFDDFCKQIQSAFENFEWQKSNLNR